MIQLPCQWCGPRNVSEFRYHGEAVPRPDVEKATPEEWRHYLYFRSNPRGWVEETWYHTAGCRRFLRLRRNTADNSTAADETAADETAADETRLAEGS